MKPADRVALVRGYHLAFHVADEMADRRPRSLGCRTWTNVCAPGLSFVGSKTSHVPSSRSQGMPWVLCNYTRPKISAGNAMFGSSSRFLAARARPPEGINQHVPDSTSQAPCHPTAAHFSFLWAWETAVDPQRYTISPSASRCSCTLLNHPASGLSPCMVQTSSSDRTWRNYMSKSFRLISASKVLSAHPCGLGLYARRVAWS
jgi:hypothetical protein